MMAVLSEIERPTENIRHTQPNVTLYVKKKLVGTGTLIITESVVAWIAGSEKGLKLSYMNIILHAVSRDANVFPHDCIYMHTNAQLPWQTDDSDSDEINEEEFMDPETQKSTELYWVPEDKECIPLLYLAIAQCQSLNPDPMDEFSPEEDFCEGDEEEVDETDQQMADLRITSNGTHGGGGDMGDELDPDRFEDAEEDLPEH